MNSKKAWYSYLTYLAFTALAAVILTEYVLLLFAGNFITSGSNALTKWIVSSQSHYYTMMYLFIFTVFLVLFVFFYLITVISRKLRKKFRFDRRTLAAWEIVILIALIAGAAAYKVYLFTYQMPQTLTDMSYFQYAQVSSDNTINGVDHGASVVYLYILSFMMSFFGNKIMTAVLLQTIIQLLSVVALYFAVKIWTGRIPAFFSAFVFSFFSVINEKLFEANPECLLFLFYCIVLLLCGVFCKRNRDSFKKTAVIGAVLLGIAVGAVCYMDMIGFTLFIFMLAIFTQDSKITDSDKDKNKKLHSVIYYLTVFIISIVTVMVLVLIKSLTDGTAFADGLNVWTQLVHDSFSFRPYMYSSGNKDISLIECSLIVFIAAQYIPSFWLHETDHSSFFIMTLAAAWTPMTGFGILSENIFSLMFWSIMAGISIQCMTVHTKVQKPVMNFGLHGKKIRVVIEDTSEAGTQGSGDAPGSSDAVNAENTDVSEKAENAVKSDDTEKPVKSDSGDSANVIDSLWNEISSELDDKEEPEKTLESDKTDERQVRYLKNPLPQPVKHKRKDMSFNHNVGEDDLGFDVDIKKDDDFDEK